MSDEQAAPAQDRSVAPASRKGRDRYVKLAFLAVAIVTVLLVWYFVQYRGPKLADAYLNAGVEDLATALNKAEAENRKVLLLVYHQGLGGQGSDYKRLVTTMAKPHNQRAFEDSGALFVRLRDSDPAVQQFDISQPPASILLRPDGEVAYRMDGYIGETAFRNELLAAPPVRFLTSLSDAFERATDAPEGQTRRIMVVVDSSPPDEKTVAFTSKTMWAKGNIQAVEDAGVICVRVPPGDKSIEKYTNTETTRIKERPTILLLSATGAELTRRSGLVDPVDFRERFLKGLIPAQ